MQGVIQSSKIIYFTICFIFLTIIGTLSHELGHIVVAKLLNYNTILHYSSMEWNNDSKEALIDFYLKNKSIIENREPFQNSLKYYKELDKIYRDEFLITLGGVLQTIITGSTSFFLLIFFRKNKLSIIQFWGLVFLSLFWSRQIFNLFKGVKQNLTKKSDSFFWGDEQKISIYLNFHEGTTSILLGLLGILICSIIIIEIVPSNIRKSFIVSAFIGSLLGYVLWMLLFGPLILP